MWIIYPNYVFSSRDFGSKYHNLYITTPCLIRPFSEFPSMIAIDKFDYKFVIKRKLIISQFIITSEKIHPSTYKK
jgi:hypothetical protein